MRKCFLAHSWVCVAHAHAFRYSMQMLARVCLMCMRACSCAFVQCVHACMLACIGVYMCACLRNRAPKNVVRS